MRALVIGGSGLFGKKTCSALLADPDFERVVAFDVVPPAEYWLKSIESYGDRYKYVRGRHLRPASRSWPPRRRTVRPHHELGHDPLQGRHIRARTPR